MTSNHIISRRISYMRDIVDKPENEKTAESLIYNCGNFTCRRAYFFVFPRQRRAGFHDDLRGRSESTCDKRRQPRDQQRTF